MSLLPCEPPRDVRRKPSLLEVPAEPQKLLLPLTAPTPTLLPSLHSPWAWVTLEAGAPPLTMGFRPPCLSQFCSPFRHTFLLCLQSINNVVMVSGGQQGDPAKYIHVSILHQTPFPSRLPHNTDQSSLCYTVGPCWFSILNTAVCTC